MFQFKLFISFIRPHKLVTTSTGGRWIKSVLSSAGIDNTVSGVLLSQMRILRVFETQKFCALLTGQMNVHFVDITSESTFILNNLFMKCLY